MAQPHHSENDAGDGQPLPGHQEKAYGHEQRHRRENTRLGGRSHALFLNEGIEVLFVELRALKPVVELF